MKKIYLAVFLACSMGGAVRAQTSEGGLPWSMSLKNTELTEQTIAKATFAQPDYSKLLKEDEADAKAGIPKPYRVAATVSSDLSLTNSGTWTYLKDGSKIWRLRIEIPEAKALGLYYDQFNLPKGVKLFLSNSNGRQVLGGFTLQNNSLYNIFSTEEIQGSVSVLEMNIDKDVVVSDIKFHVDHIYAFYRGVDEVNYFANNESTGAKPTLGESSTCHVNANCPQGNDPVFAKAKNATVRIFANGGLCSGSMINNTGNTPGGTCKLYMLTASHCDPDNSRDNAHFAAMQFRFNYQHPDCAGTETPVYQTHVGADFRSRSNLPSMPDPNPNDESFPLVADFMLLELTPTPVLPASANAQLVGWNRKVDIWNDEDYDTYVGYHHPAGDVKKFSKSSNIDPTGTFNQSQVGSTHWDLSYQVGGTAGGSSGSGLFEKDGLLIGDLSGGPGGECDGKDFGTSVVYSKISYAWENTFDQTTFPAFAGPQSQLKTWLDPTNSGTQTLGTAKYDCSDMPTGINEMEKALKDGINVYPVPSTTGVVNMKINLSTQTNLTIKVVSITGASLMQFNLSKVQSGDYALDMSSLANGIYMLSCTSSDNVSVSKKVVISK